MNCLIGKVLRPSTKKMARSHQGGLASRSTRTFCGILTNLDVFAALLMVCFGQASPRVFGQTLADVRQQAYQSAITLDSYEFEAEYRCKLDDTAEGQVASRAVFRQAGSNLRVDFNATGANDTELDPLVQDSTVAYNGKKYQWLMKGRDTLSHSDELRHPNPYWLPNPLTLPYSWLAGPTINWSDLKDPALWQDRFATASLSGMEMFGEMDCAIIEFQALSSAETYPFIEGIDEDQREMRYLVWFALDLGCVPVKVEQRRDSELISDFRVTEHSMVQLSERTVVIPTTQVLEDFTGDNARIEWLIDRSTLRLNQPIDDDLFTISPSAAGTVIDYDQLMELMVPTTPVDTGAMPWSWRRFLYIGLILVIVLLPCFIVWKRGVS